MVREESTQTDKSKKIWSTEIIILPVSLSNRAWRTSRISGKNSNRYSNRKIGYIYIFLLTLFLFLSSSLQCCLPLPLFSFPPSPFSSPPWAGLVEAMSLEGRPHWGDCRMSNRVPTLSSRSRLTENQGRRRFWGAGHVTQRDTLVSPDSSNVVIKTKIWCPVFLWGNFTCAIGNLLRKLLLSCF